MNFPVCHSLETYKFETENTPEIKFFSEFVDFRPYTIACYTISNGYTFLKRHARECRGIVFDEKTGHVVGRPFHKFFNVGENQSVPDLDYLIRNKDRIVAVYPKLDGSMIHSVRIPQKFSLRRDVPDGINKWTWKLKSKKSFNSDVVKNAEKFIENNPIKKSYYHSFLQMCADTDRTAIFEYIGPKNRIVLDYQEDLILTAVRDNQSGNYVFPDDLQRYKDGYFIPVVEPIQDSIEEIIKSLTRMKNQEGYVVYFEDGTIVKLKCPWYVKMHKTVTFLTHRNIAELCLDEQLDDLLMLFKEIGKDISTIHTIENMVIMKILSIEKEINDILKDNQHLSKKDFAIKFKDHRLFALLMKKFNCQEIDIKKWYKKTCLKDDFSVEYI